MMEIVPIIPTYIYALRYSKDELNEYHKVIRRLTDDEYLYAFFGRFKDKVSDFWIEILGDVEEEIDEYVAEVNDTILDIRDELIRICKAKDKGGDDSFTSLFEPHSRYDIRNLPEGGGKSKKYPTNFLPVKCFGLSKPSLVRLYAIELSLDCYVIIYGGIKVDLDTNVCPALNAEGEEIMLEDGISDAIKAATHCLNGMRVFDKDSLLSFMEEEK